MSRPVFPSAFIRLAVSMWLSSFTFRGLPEPGAVRARRRPLVCRALLDEYVREGLCDPGGLEGGVLLLEGLGDGADPGVANTRPASDRVDGFLILLCH